jgi:DNA polymerase III subunit epsilon
VQTIAPHRLYPRPAPIHSAPTDPTPTRPAGPAPLLFLDFEASSLDPRSWPVEIGYAWIEGGRVQRRSRVIAPRASWPLHAWSETAAAVHGITLREARAGHDADAVAAETDRFAAFEVVSDNPRWDQVWLDRLRAGRGPAIAVGSLRRAMAERLDERGADAMAVALFRGASPHRAGADAARLAAAWLAGTRAAADRPPLTRVA